jgi:hypothetical protein
MSAESSSWFLDPAAGTPPEREEAGMARYRMVYGDDEQVVRETFDDVDLVREDGWTILFRGDDAILRVRDEHVQNVERLDVRPGTGEVDGR